jgi:hypothetical protein
MECVPGDGKKCETNVTADVNNCGDCGKTCYYKNGTGSCTAETCELDSFATATRTRARRASSARSGCG